MIERIDVIENPADRTHSYETRAFNNKEKE